MKKCKEASIKETLIFQHKYCETPDSREKLINNFKITVEGYEELPPWYSTYNADGSDIRLKDDIIMLCVRDLNNLIEYYPVFPASEGIRLLRKWKMDIPPKMTAFAHYASKDNPAPNNASFRSLIAYCRLYMLEQSKQHARMAYGFNSLYKQLYDVPGCDVSADAIRLINTVLGEYLKTTHITHFGNKKTLQEFIACITQIYSLLQFQSSDFDSLRKKLKAAYPEDEIYF